MIRAAWHYLRQQGFRTAAWRAKYVLARRTGSWKRRFPEYRWHERPLGYWLKDDAHPDPEKYREYRDSSPARFFFSPGQLPDINKEWLSSDVAVADEVLGGRFTYFSWQKGDLGNPPDWLLNPFTGAKFDVRHWCDRDDLDPALGDIKYVWEPSRFGWTYALVRAYAATGDDRYPAGFWRLWESWCDGNPPQRGPNWQCGQECALRAMACIFALHAFWNAPATTDDRIASMAACLAAHAERIAGNIDFARSIKNNHTVTEAAGLYSIGLLFPEFRDAKIWRTTGKRILEVECLEQFYSDGAYIQHSFNYQRLVIHAYAWVVALARVNGDRLNPALMHALDKCVQFMWHVQEERNGQVPNYGNNDGALILPLDSCGYLDYRPALNLLYYALHDEPLYAPGPWDEPIAWLCANARGAILSPPFTKGGLGGVRTTSDLGTEKNPSQSLKGAGPRKSLHATDGGYYTLRGKESWAMVRCHTYRHRPVQADMLHVDLWWRGLNILRDAGTYSYNCPEPWLGYFQGTSAHNTVVVDGKDQMEKGERFMWYGWTKSSFEFHQQFVNNNIEFWQGTHEGYSRSSSPVTHRRAFLREGDDRYSIVDQLLGQGAVTHGFAIHYHMPLWPYELRAMGLTLISPLGPIDLDWSPFDVRYDIIDSRQSGDALGWESQYYGARERHLTLVFSGDGRTLTFQMNISFERSLRAINSDDRMGSASERRSGFQTGFTSGGDQKLAQLLPRQPLIKGGDYRGRRWTVDIDRCRVGDFWP